MTTNQFSFAVEPFTYTGAEDEEEEAGRRRQAAPRPAKAPRGRTQRPSGQRSSARPKRARRPHHRSAVVHKPAIMALPVAGSEQIRWVQNTLNQVMNLSLPVDGFMGTTTRSALRSFQEKQGLPVDGIVGPETEQALRDASSGQPSAQSTSEPSEPEPPAEEVAEQAWEDWESKVGSNRSGVPSAGWTPESLTPVPGIENTSHAFRLKVIRMAKSLKVDPNFLMAIMSFESDGFDPAKKNEQSGATGLIQFTTTTAKELGTTTDALARMTAEQQLDYVAKYFAPYRGRLKTLDDAYMAVFAPPGIGQSGNYVLYSTPTKAYQQNDVLDLNKDGKITVAEATSFVRKRLGSTAPTPISSPASPSGGQVNRSSPEYIRWVQQALNKIVGVQLTVDGISGPMTRSAIRSFQERYRLLVDGIVGPQTEGALMKAGAGNPPGSLGTVPAPYVPGGGISPQGTPDMVSVRGIQVARQIASQVSALLAAAEADGVKLSGSGYRSIEQQIELRKQNCGSSHYDIYEKPSSQCSPPTAPPGRSQHEKGLAIDFRYNDQGINAHNNLGFQWLASNAARFGLKNLPSEPWHWSVDGR